MKVKFENDDYYDYIEEIDVKNIKFLYQLRHACNVLDDIQSISSTLGIQFDKIEKLYKSGIHGSTSLNQFFKASDKEFKDLIQQYENEEIEKQNVINEAHLKNHHLICDLIEKRKIFANIGTNKAKRRLNKLALYIPLAKAIRLALEIEDKNISAKKLYGEYRERTYKQKNQLILELCKIFKEQNWIYGIQQNKTHSTTHIIYFEIPNNEQISWHFTPENIEFPKYTGEWDKKENSTLDKLETITIKLFQTESSKNESKI